MADPQSTVNAPLMQVATMTQRLDEVEFMLEFINAASVPRQPLIPVWREVFDNYLVSPFRNKIDIEGFATGRLRIGGGSNFNALNVGSVLKDPETHQIVERLSQQAIQLMLGSRDPIKAVPLGKDDPEKARLLGKLIQSVVEAPGVKRTLYQIFKSAFIFGTSYLEIGWETRSRQQVVPMPKLDSLGGLLGIDLVPEDIIYRDRPLFREIDIFDMYLDPSGTRIQEDMFGVIKRFRITNQEALQLANEGVYDLEDVKRAIRIGGQEPRAGQAGGSDTAIVGGDTKWPDINTRLPNRLGNNIGFEFWGESPIKASDGVSNRVMTMINGVRVRSRINGFMDGNIPIKDFTINPVSGRHWGLSPAEVIRFLQDSADNLLMVFNDAADLAVRSPLLVGAQFGGDPTQLREARPLDLIDCNDPKAVLPVPRDLNVLQFAAQEMIRRKQTMREASGATDPLQAIPSGGEKTATEISTLVQIASQKVDVMVGLMESEDFPWMGRTIHSRLKQFVQDGGAIASLAGEIMNVPFDAIDIEADVRFVGSRQAQNKFQRTAALEKAIAVLGQNPEVPMMFPELVTRYLRDGLDIVDGEEIVKRFLQRMLARQVGQLQGRQSASAGAGGGGGGQAQIGAGTQEATSGLNEESSFGTEAGQTEREGQAIG